MITYSIIGITALVSYLSFKRRDMFFALCMYPSCIISKKEYHRLVTHAFVHADIPHLLFNMLTLFWFGPHVENFFTTESGSKGLSLYLFLYISGAITSSIYSLIRYRNDIQYLAVGASGAISAVLFSFILVNPTHSLYLFMLPVPIPAFIFGALYLAISFYLARKNNDHIGHDAHFWGAIFGFIFTFVCYPSTIQSFGRNISSFLQ